MIIQNFKVSCKTTSLLVFLIASLAFVYTCNTTTGSGDGGNGGNGGDDGNGGDTTAPTLTGSVPADNGSMVANQNIVLTFNEDIKAGTGDITIAHGANLDIPIGDARVTISGKTLTINPTNNLNVGSGNTLTLPAGIIKDTADNATTTAITLTFTTTSPPANITDLRITNTTHNAITIGWTNPTAPTFEGVYVEMATGTTPPVNCLSRTRSATSINHLFSNLTADTVYSIRACAYYTGNIASSGVTTSFTTCVGEIGTGDGTTASPFVINGMAGAGVTHATNLNPSDNSVPRYAFSFCGVPANSINQVRISNSSNDRPTNTANFGSQMRILSFSDGVPGGTGVLAIETNFVISNFVPGIIHTAHGNILVTFIQGGSATDAFWGQADPARTAFPGAYPDSTSAISALRPQDIMISITLEKE